MVQRRKLDHLPDRFPLACQWEVTCRCNLHCVMCYTDCFNVPERIRQELSTVELLRIMEELAEAGCLELCLTGGEPLARADFFQIYERAIQLGFLVTLFTNGTLITESIADQLAALPPHRVEISLHGITETTFERVTLGRGSFQRCRQAIAWLTERRIPLTLKSTALTLNRPRSSQSSAMSTPSNPWATNLVRKFDRRLMGPVLPFGLHLNQRLSTNSINKILSSYARPAKNKSRILAPAAAGCNDFTSTPTAFSNYAQETVLRGTICGRDRSRKDSTATCLHSAVDGNAKQRPISSAPR